MSHERTHFRRNYDQIDQSRHSHTPWEKKKNRKDLGKSWGWQHGGPRHKMVEQIAALQRSTLETREVLD